MQQRLKPAVKDYLRYRRSVGKAAGTVANDQSALNALVKHAAKFGKHQDGLFIHNITDDHITHVLLEMSSDRSPRSMSVSHSAFARFFQYCVRTKRMTDTQNPMKDRERPTWHRSQKDRVMVQEFPRLLDAARHPKDRMQIALGMYLLIRVSEIRTIRLSDVLLDINEIHVRIHKSGIDDFMPIPEELRPELIAWLTWYQNECGPLKPHWYLVPGKSRPVPTKNPNGGPPLMDASTCKILPETKLGRTASRIVRVALEDIGFPVRDANGKLKGEGTHTVRRSAARGMFEGARKEVGVNALGRVQSMLHHESQTDTQWYIGTDAYKVERDDAVKGKPLFPQLKAALADENVVQLPPGANHTVRYMTFGDGEAQEA